MPFSGRKLKRKQNKKMKKEIPPNISLPATLEIVTQANVSSDFFQKRVSSSTSQASLTLETACVLPLFIILMICVVQIIEIVSVQMKLSGAIHQVSKELAHYAYIYEDLGTEEENLLEGIAVGGLSASYAKSQIIKSVGQNYLDNSIIRNGSNGLGLYQSSILEENDVIDIILNFKISLRYNIFNIPDISVMLRARTRAWTGSDAIYVDSGTGDSSDGDTVYVAVNGVVYHKNKECTHLKLSVREIGMDSVSDLRNQNGGKYYSCERCNANSQAAFNVYITETGDRYHSSLGCSGLKRDVSAMSISEVGALIPCSRCGQ